MAVRNQELIDVVSHDPLTDEIILSLVEEREWGTKGALLPDLQAKLNTYLAYIENGQLARDYPDFAGRKICFRLHYVMPPGPREQEFIRIVVEQHLRPSGIRWEQGSVGSGELTSNT